MLLALFFTRKKEIHKKLLYSCVLKNGIHKIKDNISIVFRILISIVILYSFVMKIRDCYTKYTKEG